MKNSEYLFVPVKFKGKVSIPKLNIKEKVLGLITTIQFLDNLPEISRQIIKQGKKAIIGGQILGCNVSSAIKINSLVQAFLYIGSGRFHPLAISEKSSKPIYIFNPLTNEFSKLDEKDISRAKAMKKTAKIKFFSANKIGILVSTKPGQNRLKEALKLKQSIERRGKKCYLFLFNNFDISQLENFPQIEAWINTACPGFSREHPFIWFEDIEQKEKRTPAPGIEPGCPCGRGFPGLCDTITRRRHKH